MHLASVMDNRTKDARHNGFKDILNSDLVFCGLKIMKDPKVSYEFIKWHIIEVQCKELARCCWVPRPLKHASWTWIFFPGAWLNIPIIILRSDILYILYERHYNLGFLYFLSKFSLCGAVSVTDNLCLTLESGISIQVRLLIFEIFSRGYVLIKGGYVYWFLIFKKLFKNF